MYVCYSYTMGMSDLPDMYTQSLRAAGSRAEGVHTRQMPAASRGEPEITNWTFGVVTHIIITLSNMKSRYNYVATVVN